VSSTTVVTNLNADLLDGKHAADLADAVHTHTISEITDIDTASVDHANSAGNADTLDNYHANTAVVSNTIPVRDANGDLPGNILGNAATATKLETARTISLTGDVNGSVSFDGSADVAITATVADDSHTHDTRYYTETEIDTLLSGKSDTGHVHVKADITDFDHTHVKTDITDFDHTHVKDDITDFVHTHVKDDITDFAHTHIKDDITDFDHTHVKADITDFTHTHVKADITDFAHTHTITDITDIGNASVDYANSAGDADTLDGKHADGSATPDTIPIRDVNGDLAGNITGNAATASKLQTARTIELSGDVSGSTSFDGSGNVVITATVANDSHTHDTRYYTETEVDTLLAGKSDTGHTHTKADITDFAHNHTISEISDIGNASVDYANSAGNADKLDNLHASDFVQNAGNVPSIQ